MIFKSQLFRTILAGAGVLTLIVSFQNCSKSMSSIDDEMKAKVLASGSVFGDDQSSNAAEGGAGGTGAAAGGAANGQCDGDYCPTPKPPTQSPQPNPAPAPAPTTPAPAAPAPAPGAAAPNLPATLPVTLTCSSFDGPNGDTAARVSSTSTLKLSVSGPSGTVCEETTSSANAGLLGGELRGPKAIKLDRCFAKAAQGSIKPGNYSIKLLNQKGVNLLADFPTKTAFTVLANGNVNTSWAQEKAKVYFDYNPDLDHQVNTLGVSSEGAYCQDKSSPLFVDMRNLFDKTGSFHLSSLENGVMFDIKGERAEPSAFTPYRISWFEAQGFPFIALPNKDGEVKGINELFGDNTKGPDGEFAANGYLALAKYDDDGDQLITSSDEVYSKLRLWFDLNKNGRADRGELMTLQQAGLVTIDLRYDPNFHEMDRYGNEIKYKSVAKLRNGDYRLVFDVWFNLRSGSH